MSKIKRIAVVRVRGRAKTSIDVKNTLSKLRLSRVNYCTLIDDRKSYLSMLAKVKDYVTWGKVDAEDVALILRSRGELEGHKKLTDEYIKKNTKYKDIESFSKDFVKFKAELEDIPLLKKFFRMHPPRGGHGKIKRSFVEGGALGKREGIKQLIYTMR
ncbi:MAG: 50S ribosomal protein L30 [Candidatus Hydrothermarchaeaceae archaeon]